MVITHPAPVPVTTGRGRAAIAITVVIIAVAALFSLGVGLYELLGRHELHDSLEYDDGVWFGSAVRLADGILPYRSFVMDQPPGVPLLMAPFALLSRSVGTREAFGLARLTVPFVEAVAVIATGWLVRHRGALAVLVACGVVAIYPQALINQRTVMLEPFCAALCMLGLVAAFEGDRLSYRPRRLVIAGVVFGVACSCKAFAVLPLAVVVVAVLCGRDRLRRTAALLGGLAGALVVICGPFFVLAPSQFVHQVVAVQMGRSQKVEPAIWDRLFSLIGVLPPTTHDPVYSDDSHRAVALFVAGFFGVVLLGWAVARWAGAAGSWRRGRRRLRHGARAARTGVTPLDLVALATAVVTAAGLLQPPAYYDHYSAFFAPFLAVPLGLAAGHLGIRLPRAIALVVAVALVAGAVHAVHTVKAAGPGFVEATRLDRLIPPGACVISDNAPTLVLSDRFTSTVPGCPLMVDAFGTTISSDHGFAPDSPQAAHSPAVGLWYGLFVHAQYLVLAYHYRSQRIPWAAPELRNYVRVHFRTLGTVAGALGLIRRSPAGNRR